MQPSHYCTMYKKFIDNIDKFSIALSGSSTSDILGNQVTNGTYTEEEVNNQFYGDSYDQT